MNKIFNDEQIEFLKTLIKNEIELDKKGTLPETVNMSKKERQKLYTQRWKDKQKTKDYLKKYYKEYYSRGKATAYTLNYVQPIARKSIAFSLYTPAKAINEIK